MLPAHCSATLHYQLATPHPRRAAPPPPPPPPPLSPSPRPEVDRVTPPTLPPHARQQTPPLNKQPNNHGPAGAAATDPPRAHPTRSRARVRPMPLEPLLPQLPSAHQSPRRPAVHPLPRVPRVLPQARLCTSAYIPSLLPRGAHPPAPTAVPQRYCESRTRAGDDAGYGRELLAVARCCRGRNSACGRTGNSTGARR